MISQEEGIIMNLWRHFNSKHERTPSSLAECLDSDQLERRKSWRSGLILLLIVPTLYYVNDLLSFEKLRFSERGSYFRYHNTVVVPATELAPTMTTTSGVKEEMKTLNRSENTPVCVMNKHNLGKFSIRTPRGKVFLENQYPAISKGGYFSPVGCYSRHKVAVLVPYRDREENLAVFLYNIHPFLMKQKLEYRVFVVEQTGEDKFNKGRLFNAGFLELNKLGAWHCVVFHDVDLLPLDARILYSCPSWPRHMCSTVLRKHVDPSYRTLFGGVTSMTPAQYERVNGYSNLYWGWGGEDHDMFWRLRFAGISITRYNKTIARYMSLPHPMSPPNPLRYNILRGRFGKFMQEGLSTLEYKVVSLTERHLYTHIVVDINPGVENNS